MKKVVLAILAVVVFALLVAGLVFLRREPAVKTGEFITEPGRYTILRGIATLLIEIKNGDVHYAILTRGGGLKEAKPHIKAADKWFFYIERPGRVWVYDGRWTIGQTTCSPDGEITGRSTYRPGPGGEPSAPAAVRERAPHLWKEPHEEARKFKNAKVAWDAPVNGLQAGISQEGEAPGRLIIGYHLRNAGKEDLRLLKLDVASTYANTWLEVSVAGKVRPYSGAMIEPPPPPQVSDFIYLPPGKSLSLQLKSDPANWKLKPGDRAKLTFVFKNLEAELDGLAPYDPETKSGQKVTGLWVGTARSGSIEVVVK